MQSIGLNQTLTQTTKLSPAQIQVIRMLELPSIELGQRINEELQENPALEEGHEEKEEWTNDLSMDEEGYMPDDGLDDGRQRDPLQNEDFNYDRGTQSADLPH